ncbi:MAG TPA: DUF2231 domain-containing protein [Bryobacteraceae bacterium]|nr:DUF2231 domain-containing protein [Bryobacteraceae bacterium]
MEHVSWRLTPAAHRLISLLPFELFAAAVVLDILSLRSGVSKWTVIAFWIIGLGVAIGLLAAFFGFLRWASTPAGTRANSAKMYHCAGMLLAVACFAASWFLRRGTAAHPDAMAYLFSFLGAGVTVVTALAAARKAGHGLPEQTNLTRA